MSWGDGRSDAAGADAAATEAARTDPAGTDPVAGGATARAADVLAAVRQDPTLLDRFSSLYPGTEDPLSALAWAAGGNEGEGFERRDEIRAAQAVAYGRDATPAERDDAHSRLAQLERRIAADRDEVRRGVDAFLLTREPAHGSELGGDGGSDGDDRDLETSRRRRRFPRAVIAGALAAALLLSALVLPGLRVAAREDSLAVFDRAQTADDRGEPSLFRYLLFQNDLIEHTEAAWVEAQQDIRLLGGAKGISVYAGRVPGGLICVAAVGDAAANGACVTEADFRDHGMQLDSYELPDPADPGRQGVVRFSWGPRGDLTAEYSRVGVTTDA